MRSIRARLFPGRSPRYHISSHLDAHGVQPGDALGHRRVGGEQLQDAPAPERVDDHHVRGRRLRVAHGAHAVEAFDPLQGRGELIRPERVLNLLLALMAE